HLHSKVGNLSRYDDHVQEHPGPVVVLRSRDGGRGGLTLIVNSSASYGVTLPPERHQKDWMSIEVKYVWGTGAAVRERGDGASRRPSSPMECSYGKSMPRAAPRIASHLIASRVLWSILWMAWGQLTGESTTVPPCTV